MYRNSGLEKYNRNEKFTRNAQRPVQGGKS